MEGSRLARTLSVYAEKYSKVAGGGKEGGRNVSFTDGCGGAAEAKKKVSSSK